MHDFGTANLALDARAKLAECPLWSVAEQCLYWVDISGCTIHRFDPLSGKDQRWATPCEPGCIGLAATGGLIAALRDGFYRFYPATGTLNKIADAPYDTALFRFNDGRCDTEGRYWAGAMYEPRTAESASMYALERGRVREAWGAADARGVKVSNGLAFSADGKKVFQSDTPNHVIYQFDLANGDVGARRVFARCVDNRDAPDYGGRPDGAAIDCEGNYWSAQYEGRRVLRYSPAGKVTGVVHVPARRVTMVAFGGADLRTLYITTAREGASADELRHDPHAGGIFTCSLGVAGCAEPRYID